MMSPCPRCNGVGGHLRSCRYFTPALDDQKPLPTSQGKTLLVETFGVPHEVMAPTYVLLSEHQRVLSELEAAKAKLASAKVKVRKLSETTEHVWERRELEAILEGLA